jgi:hypothetical protein
MFGWEAKGQHRVVGMVFDRYQLSRANRRLVIVSSRWRVLDRLADGISRVRNRDGRRLPRANLTFDPS